MDKIIVFKTRTENLKKDRNKKVHEFPTKL